MAQPRTSGQSTVEWVGLLALVALLLVAVLHASGARLPGTTLADAIAERLVCAVRLSEDCRREPELIASYGDDTAALLRAHAPTIRFEDGMSALPVDYRRCRDDRCAAGPGGTVARSARGRAIVAFTHVLKRRGSTYLQYWFYYPGSATAEGSTPLKGVIREVSGAIGKSTYHPDDWESYQVRIGPGGRVARASSHHGYGDGWLPDPGALFVSGGSHAGQARRALLASRRTKDHRLKLIPIERIARSDGTRFAITPPWLKKVYSDPEYGGTD